MPPAPILAAHDTFGRMRVNMKRLFGAASTGLLALMLGGCAAMDWGTHLASFKYTPDDKNDAIVLVSAGSPESCGANPMSIRLLADGTHSPILATNVMGFNSKLDTGMYPDHQGVLMALRVPPGHYRVFPYPFNAVNFRPVEVPLADLTVGAGEVVYAGEIYLATACDPLTRVEFRDAFDRDLRLLKAQNPVLAQAAIQKRLMVARREIP